MAEPYFDRDKMVTFLSAHAPAVKKPLSLVLESEHGHHVRNEHAVVLRIPSVVGQLETGMEMLIEIHRLFPPTAPSFSMVEVAHLHFDEFCKRYAEKVNEQLKLLRFSLAWETNEPYLDTAKVKQREHVGNLRCHLRVQGSMLPHSPVVGYTHKPYVSVTDERFSLKFFLEEKTLDEAWRECWVGPVRHREFT